MVVQPNRGTWNQWHFEVFEFNKANIQTANQGSSGQQAIKRIKERYLSIEIVFASDGACLMGSGLVVQILLSGHDFLR